jgi:hypothetical protein
VQTKIRGGSLKALSEFLPLFLQKESGFQGEALRISTGEKAFCTLFTQAPLKKVDKNFKLSNALHSITRVQRAKALCRVV